LDDKLAAQGFGLLKRVGGDAIRVDDNLRQAEAIAQIKKNDATVVSAPMHPSCQCDRFAGMFVSKLPARVCFEHS
jgi:hypothetical protein